MKAWWAGLEARERRLLLMTSIIFVLFIAWLAGWRPLVAAQVRSESRLDAARETLAWMRAADLEAARLTATPTLSGNRGNLSLLALAEQSARSAGLGEGFRRSEPVGDDRLRVTLQGVPFDALARWLTLLEQRYGVIAEEFAADRSGAPGLVDVRLLLAE